MMFRILCSAAVAAGLLLGQAQIAKQPKFKSQKEQEAVMAVFNAADVDGRIAAITSAIEKFADSEFKPLLLLFAADAYRSKGDTDNMLLWAERALEADPKSYQSMLLIGSNLAQRTREFDLDKEEKLGRAEKLAREAIAIAKASPKPRADITDEQWAGAVKDFESQGHEILGMAAMVRKKHEDAVKEFQLSVEGAMQADPATFVRLGLSLNNLKRYDEAIAALDKAISDPNAAPQVKQMATQEKMRAIEAKSKAAPPKQ